MKSLLLFSLLLVGCAAKKECRRCLWHVPMTAHYNTHDCEDLPNGMFRCKNVTFDPHVVPVK